MAILNIVSYPTGVVGVNPSIVYIETNDTSATVLTTGYLNKAVQQGYTFNESMMACVSTKTSPSATSTQVAWLEVSKSGANWSLVPTASPGSVILPVGANHIAMFSGTSGALYDGTAPAIHLGIIQAGQSGTTGSFISFSATPTTGYMSWGATANLGDFTTIITNAPMGQNSTLVIPNPFTASASFVVAPAALVNGNLIQASGTAGLVSDSGKAAATIPTFTSPTIASHIAVFTNTAGNLGEDAATAINGGNIQAGLAGTAGTVASFPATGANGSLILAATNAGGAFNTTISNGTMAQSTVYTMGDIGASTGGLVVATTAIRMKSVAGAAAAGGSAAQSFTDAFCTTGSNVVGNWNTQTTPASVLKIVPGNGSFVVTSSADAGVGTFNYIITK